MMLLKLVEVQGTESLVEWVEDPSYPNITLSWNIIYGSCKIQQEISKSSNYYIAVGNFNSEEVETDLNYENPSLSKTKRAQILMKSHIDCCIS
ncbi:hypothetical protein CRYUN_Cryun25bG0093000 [Craigia yunnanensis]